jgi:hypothetical protein
MNFMAVIILKELLENIAIRFENDGGGGGVNFRPGKIY